MLPSMFSSSWWRGRGSCSLRLKGHLIHSRLLTSWGVSPVGFRISLSPLFSTSKPIFLRRDASASPCASISAIRSWFWLLSSVRFRMAYTAHWVRTGSGVKESADVSSCSRPSHEHCCKGRTGTAVLQSQDPLASLSCGYALNIHPKWGKWKTIHAYAHVCSMCVCVWGTAMAHRGT